MGVRGHCKVDPGQGLGGGSGGKAKESSADSAILRYQKRGPKTNSPYSSFRLTARLWGQNHKNLITFVSQQM